MPDEYLARAGRIPRKTHLTSAEDGAFHRLKKKLGCLTDADVIRFVLRDRFKVEGLLG